MCRLISYILIGVLSLAIIWLTLNNIGLNSKIKSLTNNINGVPGHYKNNDVFIKWISQKEGLIDKSARLELQLKKQKEIIAELCDFVYKDN